MPVLRTGGVGASLLLVGAIELSPVGAIELTFVGASPLSRVGATNAGLFGPPVSVRGDGRCELRNSPFSSAGMLADSALSQSASLNTLGFAHGIVRALSAPMRGARHFSELTVWQLADELRVETLTLTGRRRSRAT